MGKVKCSKHGSSTFVVTCSHAGEQIDKGRFPTARRFDVIQRLFVCDECLKLIDAEECKRLDRAGGPILLDDSSFEAWEAVHDALPGKRFFCSKCVSELERLQKS